VVERWGACRRGRRYLSPNAAAAFSHAMLLETHHTVTGSPFEQEFTSAAQNAITQSLLSLLFLWVYRGRKASYCRHNARASYRTLRMHAC
jgi:hypothetical protein